jgi:hypothetical protein
MQLDLYEEVFPLVGVAPGYTITGDGRVYGPSGRRLSSYRHGKACGVCVVTTRRRWGLTPGRSAMSVRSAVDRSLKKR